MDAEHELISGCLNQEPVSQEKFYRQFAAKMFGICLRYAVNPMEAEDMLQCGFIHIFSRLHQFRFEGSLEGWVKKIIIHTAVNYCRKQAKFQLEVELKEDCLEATISEDALSVLSTKDLLAIVQGLPTGRRTVFNLYVIEGYCHREIGEMLGISEGTSKSQLHRAKASIRKYLMESER